LDITETGFEVARLVDLSRDRIQCWASICGLG